MVKRVKVGELASSMLLVIGVILVLVGFIMALGFTATGLMASTAAIAGLLYAGSVWFGPAATAGAHTPPQPVPLVVFDRDQHVVSGGAPGLPVAATFPHIIRPEIERRCADALSGTTARFACLFDGRTTVFEVLPVRTADGVVVYGMLMASESVPAIAASA